MISLRRGCRSSAPDEHQAQQMDGGLRMPAPARRFQHTARARLQVGVVGLPHGLGRQVRMDVDRHVEIDGRRQQAVVARMIEEAAFGRAVDERADEAQLLHRAPKLARDSIGALHGQHGEARKARRVPGNRGCQVVVHLAGKRHAVRARHEIGAGARIGQHLHRDPGLVHGAEALLADLRRQLQRVGGIGRRRPRPEPAPADDGPIDPAHQLRRREMLLERDDTHRQSPPPLLIAASLTPGKAAIHHEPGTSAASPAHRTLDPRAARALVPGIDEREPWSAAQPDPPLPLAGEGLGVG